MKRFVLTYNEERVIDRLHSEYRVARKARTRALAGLARADAMEPSAIRSIDRAIYSEQLAAAREVIRLTTELVNLIRTQR